MTDTHGNPPGGPVPPTSGDEHAQHAAQTGQQPYYQQSYQQPSYQNQQPQQMGFATQNQRQEWQQSAPGGQQPSYSQGDPDDFSVIDDSDDLPF